MQSEHMATLLQLPEVISKRCKQTRRWLFVGEFAEDALPSQLFKMFCWVPLMAFGAAGPQQSWVYDFAW